MQKCLGLAIKLPNGQSPHSAYPFSFHDQFGDPWDYSVRRGVLTIFSPSCGPLKHSEDVCESCKALENDKRLQGILKRATDGIHENTPLAFHSLGSLQTINRQKQATIRGLRLGRLNDARKLVRKEGALQLQKQFMMAIGSRKVERVEKIVAICLRRKMGMKAILETYERAARGVYRPRSYTEEEELKARLLWRMGGCSASNFAYKALGLPSYRKTRRLELVPPIIPCSRSPSLSDIKKNVVSSFKPIGDLVQKHGIRHQILMFDEVALERRLRWQRLNNMILGVCQEHGSQVSLEFKTAGDVHALIDALARKEIHFSSEVSTSIMQMSCICVMNTIIRQPWAPLAF